MGAQITVPAGSACDAVAVKSEPNPTAAAMKRLRCMKVLYPGKCEKLPWIIELSTIQRLAYRLLPSAFGGPRLLNMEGRVQVPHIRDATGE